MVGAVDFGDQLNKAARVGFYRAERRRRYRQTFRQPRKCWFLQNERLLPLSGRPLYDSAGGESISSSGRNGPNRKVGWFSK